MKTKQDNTQPISKRSAVSQKNSQTTASHARHYNVIESHDAEEMESFNSIGSLSDYRLVYPQTAGIPTITQNSFLGLVLARVQRREQRRQRRRERMQKLLSLPVKAFSWMKQEIGLLTHHRPVRMHRHA